MSTATPLAKRLRRRMADSLLTAGALTSPGWHRAFATVPREAFVPEFSVRAADGASGLRRRLGLTQHDTATNSSTRPHMMALMLEALRPLDGARILEVGTGTGYNDKSTPEEPSSPTSATASPPSASTRTTAPPAASCPPSPPS
ncbi:hypothetical protein [Streptomyces synnematoformans]|uniref:Protein-L-isoaspartate O-methyltransferase n=1 Tax=Streptomyces synnematoformans TaxID=415721 RepID=A0ABN2XM77_9ACTN